VNNKWIRIAIVIAAIIAIYIVSRGRFPGEYYTVSGFTQGTTYHITFETRSARDLKPLIDSILQDFDYSLSAYIPNSIITKINQNEPGIEADDHFIAVFNKAREVNKETGGAFDITVAPIVNAWGFGYTEKADVDSTVIDSLLQYVGMNKVKLSGRRVIKDSPGILFDVNAIAQGYSVDVVSEYLESIGIRNYLVEIGGEVRAKGKNPKHEYWKVGIDKPVENNMIPGAMIQTVLGLSGRSLATSGNYRKFYEKDGIKYTHSINPLTGYPVVSNLLSATVVTRDCITADAYATAFMVMGLERSISFLSEHKQLDAYLIFSDDKGNFRTYTTEGLKKSVME